MKESQKGDKGDHRIVSDPIPERKDFIKHIKENAPVEENVTQNPNPNQKNEKKK
jgi:hypothetical protein